MRSLLEIGYLVGRPFSPVYALLMKIRAYCYRRGVFRQHRLPVPVISVGNLTLGGTGKTPVVQYIIDALLQNGHRPAIVSRGYGGTAKKAVNIVSDGTTLFLSAAEAGDEPRLHAERFPTVPVLTGTNRLFPCQYAIDSLHADVLVLDDGFQHLRIARDIDIVLFNGSTLLGNGHVFPGGELRESLGALQRADMFVCTGVTGCNGDAVQHFFTSLHTTFPQTPLFQTTVKLKGIREMAHDQGVDPSDLPTPLLGLCGIAHPARFQRTLRECAITPSGFVALQDHKQYDQALLDSITEKAISSGAKGIITTEKDGVKLLGLHSRLPIYLLSIAIEADPEFLPAVLRDLNAVKTT